jgi:hypothetical protein
MVDHIGHIESSMKLAAREEMAADLKTVLGARGM